MRLRLAKKPFEIRSRNPGLHAYPLRYMGDCHISDHLQHGGSSGRPLWQSVKSVSPVVLWFLFSLQDFNFRFIIHPGGIPQHMRFSLASSLPERFHRHEAWAAELLRQEPMPHPSHRPPLALGARALARRALWPLAALLTLSACEKNHPAPPAAAPVVAVPAPVTVSPLARQLAAARL